MLAFAGFYCAAQVLAWYSASAGLQGPGDPSGTPLLLLILGATSIALAPVAHAQKRVALVIGNSKYQWEASLPNVRRDAMEIARRFRGMGLATDLVEDADHDAMLRAIEKLGAAARGANLAAFYFAGHGANWGRDTYIVPVDTNLGDPSVVQTLVPVPSVTTMRVPVATW